MSTDNQADVTSHARPLWAPWRVSYIVNAREQTGCFFCSKAEADHGCDCSNHVIARCDAVFALLNTFPYCSGHMLVAPCRHVADLSEMTDAERLGMMQLTVKIEALLRRVMHPDGFNIGINLGVAAGAGVPGHLHQHIVPRWVGDTNFMPVFADVRVVPEALDETARILREAWDEMEAGASSEPRTT